MNIFVYGTLLKGLQRERALSRSELIGSAYIKGELYDLGRFPALKEGEEKVYGELYEINEQTLFRLDQIEAYDPDNHQDSLYLRIKTQVSLIHGEETIDAETYFYNRSVEGRSTKITSGDYRKYLDSQGFV